MIKVILVDIWNIRDLEKLLNEGWTVTRSESTRDYVYYILEKN